MDGVAFPGITVRRLAAALVALPTTSPPTVDLGRAFLQRHAESALETSFDLPAQRKAARTAYLAMFMDGARLKRYVATIHWANDHTDDDHVEKVRVDCARGVSIVASTVSQAQFGVPWTVTSFGRAAITYNVEIGRNLSDLLGARDINHERYGDDGLARSYALSVLGDYTSKYGEPDAFDQVPELKAALDAAGFKHDAHGLDERSHGWDYYVESPDQPGFQFYGVVPTDAGAEEAQTIVASSRTLLARLRVFPWLRKALATYEMRGYAIGPEGDGYDVAADVKALRESGLDAAAALLADNARSSIAIVLYRDEPTNALAHQSDWYLLPDGRLLLVRYDEGALKVLDLAEAALGPLHYGHASGGEVFSPDGSWSRP